METVTCDMCDAELSFDNSGMDTAPVLVVGPGMIYYPSKGFGSYNGAEVHMDCAVNWQMYMLSEGFIKFE